MVGAPVGYTGRGICCAAAYVGGETSMKRKPGCWACAQAITEAMPTCRTRVYSPLVIAAPEGQSRCARVSDRRRVIAKGTCALQDVRAVVRRERRPQSDYDMAPKCSQVRPQSMPQR